MAEAIVELLYRPGNPIILAFLNPSADTQLQGNPFQQWEALNTLESKFFWRFSTEIAVYLGNSTKKAHGCYGTLIGSHR